MRDMAIHVAPYEQAISKVEDPKQIFDRPQRYSGNNNVQPKPIYMRVPNGKLQPNMICACLDLRVPNKFMKKKNKKKKNRITQGPIVENFICKFHECVVFLNLRSGYRQLMLHLDSRAAVTFSIPWGNYRPKQLIFRAKALQDLFDDMLFKIFGDIAVCLNQWDDILIRSRNNEAHNETLRTVLQRAEDYGVTFNLDKCQLGVEELEFSGYRFTKEGLKPALEKIKAVKDCESPETSEALKSFLSMIGYLFKFIIRYASMTA